MLSETSIADDFEQTFKFAVAEILAGVLVASTISIFELAAKTVSSEVAFPRIIFQVLN